MFIVLACQYLHWSEETFWKSTPRKYRALIDSAMELERLKWGGKNNKLGKQHTSVQNSTIDNIPGWN